MEKWGYETFSKSSFEDPVSEQLKDFLNKNCITEFHIIQMLEDYIEIVYKL